MLFYNLLKQNLALKLSKTQRILVYSQTVDSGIM